MQEILLDPGHSILISGTTDKSKKILEHSMNVYQAERLKSELIDSYLVDIIDPSIDNRIFIGTQARNYRLFISLHLNSFDTKTNYTCVCVDARYATPDSNVAKLASRFSGAIAKSIGINSYQGKSYPVGVMPRSLEVLSAAHKSGCELCFLTEAFFLDYYSDEKEIKLNCDKAMKALAGVIRKAIA